MAGTNALTETRCAPGNANSQFVKPQPNSDSNAVVQDYP
jgi:hypothetical protein